MDRDKKDKKIFILIIVGVIIIGGIASVAVINTFSSQEIMVGGLTFQIPTDYKLSSLNTREQYGSAIEEAGYYNNGSGDSVSILVWDRVYNPSDLGYSPVTINGVNGHYREFGVHEFYFVSNGKTIFISSLKNETIKKVVLLN